MRCWGKGETGQLGYGNEDNIGDDETPASAGEVDIEPDVVQLAADGFHTCALLESGTVRCWGAGQDGRLGYGDEKNIGDDETPATAGAVAVGGPVDQLVAGGHHTCALLESGTVRCWGQGGEGQLGYGDVKNIGDGETPATAGDVALGGPVVQLAAGLQHTCALLKSGAVRCWGHGEEGQLGYGNESNVGDDEAPATAEDVEMGGLVVQLVAGNAHTCALLDGGGVRCWGRGFEGQLGYGNKNDIGDDETPAMAGDVALGVPVVQLAAGGFHTCALLKSGMVRCWGAGADGRLGYDHVRNIGDDETPVEDVMVGGLAVQLTAGEEHTCALLESGGVRCWGKGEYGRLGYGDESNIGGGGGTPADEDDVAVGGPAVQLAAGGYHTCALLESGGVRCWGYGELGQLGYGNTLNIGDDEDETPETAGDVELDCTPHRDRLQGHP